MSILKSTKHEEQFLPCENSKEEYFKAVKSNNIAKVEEFLKNGMPIDTQNIDFIGGQTALLFASQMGFKDMVLMLLKYKANIDKSDNIGNVPFTISIDNGHMDIARILFNHGVCSYDLSQAQDLNPHYFDEKGNFIAE